MITPTPQLLGAFPTSAQLLAYQAPSTPLPLNNAWSSQGAATSPLTFGTVPTALVPTTLQQPLQQPLLTTPTPTVNPLDSTFNTPLSLSQTFQPRQDALSQALPLANTPFGSLAPLPLVNPQVLAGSTLQPSTSPSTSTPSTPSTDPANNPLANFSPEQINAALAQLGIDPSNLRLSNTNGSNSTNTPSQESPEVDSLPINQPPPQEPTSPRSDTSTQDPHEAEIDQVSALLAEATKEKDAEGIETYTRRLKGLGKGDKPSTTPRQEADTPPTPSTVSDKPPSTAPKSLNTEITGGLSPEVQKIINKSNDQITPQDAAELKATVKRQDETIETLRTKNKRLQDENIRLQDENKRLQEQLAKK